MSQLVVLVHESSALALVEKLSRQVPVWIADIPAHEQLKLRQKADDGSLQLTWFALRQGESLQDAAFRIVISLDQHYDENSQDVPYDVLWFVGLPSATEHLERLTPLGFKRIESAWNGWIAIK